MGRTGEYQRGKSVNRGNNASPFFRLFLELNTIILPAINNLPYCLLKRPPFSRATTPHPHTTIIRNGPFTLLCFSTGKWKNI